MKAYQIKIELLGTNPLIWRRVIMPEGATFKRLHDIIQNANNFLSGYPYEPCHLYEFELPEENIIVTNDDEAYQDYLYYKKNSKLIKDRMKNCPPEHVKFNENHLENLNKVIRKPSGLKIDKYIEKYGLLNYSYDFGDDWKFLIVLEKTVEDYYLGYPTLISGAQTAPPEDVGGVHGYYEFLKIYNNELHPDHKEIMAWVETLCYNDFDIEFINRFLKPIKYKKTEWDKIDHDNYVIKK